MKRLVVLYSLPLIASAPLAAMQWEPPDEVLQVQIYGKGDWLVSCQWQDYKGKSKAREAHGADDRHQHLHVLRAESGSCSYKAAPEGELTIRLDSPLYRCTLPSPEEGECMQTFPAGSQGEFRIEKRNWN